jgi:hypothetical protein
VPELEKELLELQDDYATVCKACEAQGERIAELDAEIERLTKKANPKAGL